MKQVRFFSRLAVMLIATVLMASTATTRSLAKVTKPHTVKSSHTTKTPHIAMETNMVKKHRVGGTKSRGKDIHMLAM